MPILFSSATHGCAPRTAVIVEPGFTIFLQDHYALLTVANPKVVLGDTKMNRACIIATLFLTVRLAAAAQSTVTTPTLSAPMSSHKLHNAIKSAQSSAQYKQLATYYHQQEGIYRARATEEKIEEDRRAKVNVASYQKYPRPVDSSRYRYEMFSADADRAAVQAAHWDQLATGTP